MRFEGALRLDGLMSSTREPDVDSSSFLFPNPHLATFQTPRAILPKTEVFGNTNQPLIALP